MFLYYYINLRNILEIIKQITLMTKLKWKMIYVIYGKSCFSRVSYNIFCTQGTLVTVMSRHLLGLIRRYSGVWAKLIFRSYTPIIHFGGLFYIYFLEITVDRNIEHDWKREHLFLSWNLKVKFILVHNIQ